MIRRAGRTAERAADRLREGLRDESVGGLRQMSWLRTIAMLIIGVWLCATLAWPGVVFYLGILVIAIVSGLLQHMVAEKYPRTAWPAYLFILFDAALLSYVLTAPNPMGDPPWPPQYILRFGNFGFFYLLLTVTLLSYRPLQVLWAGIAIGFCWLVGVAIVMQRAGTVTFRDFGGWFQLSPTEQFVTQLNPSFVDVVQPFKEAFVLLLVAAILASVVWRMRRLAMRHVRAERARANLVRYFSPNLVDELVEHDQSLSEERELQAAVLFLDIVGFTSIAADQAPLKTMALIREFHARMTGVAFAYRATIDKFIGDAMMATFGVPQPGQRDAADALACARALLEELDRWNAERAEMGEEPVRIGIGIHYGPVVAGDVGGEGRFEFTVIGDTVNVANVLEHATRELGAVLVVSDVAVSRARAELGTEEPLLLDGLQMVGPLPIRGRDTPVPAWVLLPRGL